MSLSETVDEKYRISVDDLDGHARRLVIANVSYQGVEEMRPVLHFEGLTKRLVLTSNQSHDMIRLTHTAIPSDWIGETVNLRPEHSGDDRIIKIDSPLSRMGRFSLAAWTGDGRHVRKLLALLGAIAVLTVALWAGYLYGDSLLLLVQDWLP